MCAYDTLPGVIFPSTSDLSQPAVGLRCVRTEKPIGSSVSSWTTFWKILRLVEEIPFLP